MGWTLIVMGAIVALYVFWSLVWTDRETAREQATIGAAWDAAMVDAPAPPADGGAGAPDDQLVPVSGLPDGIVARLEFSRPGSEERPVAEQPLYVVEGTGREELMRGPGRYTTSSAPGEDGNFAVAGHRTTYGAPFHTADELVPGDRIEVTDVHGRTFAYEVVDSEIVAPRDTWVIGEDPLETGRPMLTLTTCHPRYSAAQRLIVFAELVDEVRA